MYTCPMTTREENLVGAFVLKVADNLAGATSGAVGHQGAMGAALSYLAQEPGIGVEELRRPLALSEPAAVRLASQLHAAGLVSRAADDGDGRRVRLTLTPAGRRAAHAVLAARAGVLADSLAGLGDGERRELAQLLEKALRSVATTVAAGQRICRLCQLDVCPRVTCPVDLAARHEVGT